MLDLCRLKNYCKYHQGEFLIRQRNIIERYVFLFIDTSRGTKSAGHVFLQKNCARVFMYSVIHTYSMRTGVSGTSHRSVFLFLTCVLSPEFLSLCVLCIHHSTLFFLLEPIESSWTRCPCYHAHTTHTVNLYSVRAVCVCACFGTWLCVCESGCVRDLVIMLSVSHTVNLCHLLDLCQI